MGNQRSSLRKLRLHGAQSLMKDCIFLSFNKVQTFEEFHQGFLDFCSKLNSILPGRQFHVRLEEVRGCYDEWIDPSKDEEEKKDLIVELIQEHAIIDHHTNDAVLVTGLVAPPVAMIFKRVVPDIIFIPTCTLLAVLVAKMIQNNKSNDVHGNKSPPSS